VTIPLSFDQERMWLVDRLLPASVSPDDPVVVRLRGPLRLACLTAALDQVVARHASLRTRFPLDDGVPQQVVVPYAALPVMLVDLSRLARAHLDQQAAGLVAAEAARPFDLERGPLCRVTAIRLGALDHVLCIAIHHLAVDLWSTALMVDELSTAYRAAAGGLPPGLPAITLQPADIGLRARARLTPRRLAMLREYWRERLAGVRPVELPADHPRPTLPNLGSHVYLAQLDERLSDGLRDLGRCEGVTLFVTLLAGLHALVAGLTGQVDFVVVSVSAGRRSRDSEQVVGMLTECLVVRVDASGDPTVRELLTRDRDAVLDAFDGLDLPFAEVVALVDPGRDLEPSPLRQLGLTVHNVPRAAPSLPGLALEGLAELPPSAATGVSEADLWLEVFDDGRGPLRLRLQMDDRMYDPGSLPLMVDRLRTLLSACVAEPARRLSELPRPIRPAARSPAPASTPAGLDRRPERATVEAVARLVASLLRVSGVCGEDNFFRLGGTSLDAARLAARIERELGVRVGLYDLVAVPTINAMAYAVDMARSPPGSR
jgi:Condensation domain/Phosphopantetheine attachment site